MISKRIDRLKKSSSYARLGRYVLEAKTDQAAILWARTADYVVDTPGEGEKVLWSRLSNCEAEIPILAIAEIEATQAQNTRSKADKTYHCVVSFPEGEFPTRVQLEDIEDELCKALGFEAHQRISAVHQDTENLHLHMAINKVHPETFKVLEPYRDYYIRDKACRALEKKHGLTIDNGMGQGKRLGRAGELEAYQGEECLLSWVQTHLEESLKQACAQEKSWEALHAVLAEHDLVIKPRGAGLVIGTLDGKLHIKASSVDRSLSFKKLTEQLGPYEAGKKALEHENRSPSSQEGQKYERGPKQRGQDANSLYAQFQKERDSMRQMKAQAFNLLRATQAQERERLKEWYRERRASVKANETMTAKTKRGLYQELAKEIKADFAQRKMLEVEQRTAIRTKHAVLSWDDWLIQQTIAGNGKAISVLRWRVQFRAKMGENLLTAENLEVAKHIVYPHVSKVQKNGAVVYRVKGGGMVSDEAHAVKVPEVTDGAALLALSLASERFAGKLLVVEGSAEFRLKVAELSAVKGLSVRFADADLEKARQRFELVRELAVTQKQQKDKEQEHTSVKAKRRNLDQDGPSR